MRNVIKKLTLRLTAVAVGLVLMLITLLPVSAASTVLGYVNGVNVNLRTGAGTGYTSLGKLSHVQVEILGSATDSSGAEWKKIRYGSLEGYMHGQYVTVLSSSQTAPTFEEQLALFPEDYREPLRALHSIYPNWSFTADNLSVTFDKALAAESTFPTKLIPASYPNSLKSMGENAYNWSTGVWATSAGNWVGASKELVAYYMDPRNFLNTTDIWMFATLSFDRLTQTREGVEKIVAGTFLANGFSDKSDYNGSYIDIIMEAAAQSGVSPYMIASTIIQEQGANGTSALISGNYTGYVGYYNFFNFGASGTTEADVIKNGLTYAKNQGWTSRSAAIIGGAKKISGNYFSRGQDTYYYKNFDVQSGNFSFQYAQNIYDSKNSAASLRKMYIGDTASVLNFSIPVYKDMWETAPAKPEESSKKNNYYFLSLDVSGFYMHQRNYALIVSQDTRLTYTLPAGAQYTGDSLFQLKSGSNTVVLPIKAESGAESRYTLTVTAAKDCLLSVRDKSNPLIIPDAPEVLQYHNGRLSLIGKTGHEYSIDKINWQSSPIFENIPLDSVVSVYCRTSAEEVSAATKIMAVSAPKIKLVGSKAVAFEAQSGFLYSVDAINWQSTSVLGSLEAGKRYTLYKLPQNREGITVFYDSGTEFTTYEQDITPAANASGLAFLRRAVIDDLEVLDLDINSDAVIDIRDVIRLKKQILNIK